MGDVHVLGVRHHGPGSARAVAAALAELQPDVVVIEGAPELDGLVDLARSPDLVPPVAALAYVPDAPKAASFYPMASFSPEWVALRWAVTHGATVRFADLPAANALAPQPDPDPSFWSPEPATEDGSDEPIAQRPGRVAIDPLGRLAAAAGMDDAERWWEDAIEHRHHGLEAFAVVRDAMAELRAVEAEAVAADTETLRREAAMRQVLRAVLKDKPERVAVVCGAWHAPVLVPETFPTQTADRKLLTGLAKVKVAVTWVPWTNARLASNSGYGAGVTSPGWYQHQHTETAEPVLRWLVATSRALRAQQLDASAASTIEAVRLAEALAAVRGRPAPGLAEVTDASQAVLCGGSDVPLALIERELVVGHARGSVPADTPTVPLARDLAKLQKKLRLKVNATPQVVTLDLRTDSHLERSTLFHRLGLLSIAWASPADAGKTLGTFKEAWSLLWEPELDLAVIEAARLGTTVATASAAAATELAAQAPLPKLAALVEQTLLADLPEARRAALAALDARAAEGADLTLLMGAVEPLARVRRYGDVRGTDTAAVGETLAALVTRIVVGLPRAASDVGDDLAAEVLAGIDSVQRGVALVADPEQLARWRDGLARLLEGEHIHGSLAGRAERLLLDAGVSTTADTERRLGLVLHPAAEVGRGAAWLEGFLAGDETVLLHDERLLALIDEWLQRIPEATFDAVLPLLRRSFGGFAAASRRHLGNAVVQLGRGPAPVAQDDLDADRASLVEARVLQLLGVTR